MKSIWPGSKCPATSSSAATWSKSKNWPSTASWDKSRSRAAKASDLSAANQLSALAHENYELKANADLAKLVRMLPGTLKIREGTEVTSGQVALVATARQQADGMSWSGRVDASHLGGTADGRPIAWENPLAIQFATHETKDGIIVDQAVCTSSFLQVNGSGSLDDMTATADFDLAQLVTELRRFSDLDQVQLAGKGHARLQLKRPADNQFTADADFQARGFQWIAQNPRPLDGRQCDRASCRRRTVERTSAEAYRHGPADGRSRQRPPRSQTAAKQSPTRPPPPGP